MKIYRVLLLAFPRRVRREFGPDMERMFDEQLLLARRDGTGPIRLWAMAAWDALRYGLAERLGGDRPGHRTRTPRKPWRTYMTGLLQDLKYVRRLLAAQPAVSAIAVLTLALGVGANAAVFSAVDALLLRPLPYPEADRLVMVWEKREAEGVLTNVVAPADYLDWAEMNAVFASMAAFAPTTVDLTGQGEPMRLYAAAVSPPFFDVFAVRPALGRSFLPDEETVGNHRVVILTHGLWQAKFGSDSGIVGRRLLLNGVPFEVVGVLPESFEFADESIEIWAPLALRGVQPPPSRVSHSFNVYARMKPGVTLEQARADMARVGAHLSQQYPEANRTHGAWVNAFEDELRGPLRGGLLLLLGAVSFVLLIACVNVANLLLASAASRRREIAVRAAVGASRPRLVRQILTESVVLALLGGLAGALVAYWGIAALRELAPADVPLLGQRLVALTPRVLWFTVGVSVAAGVLFGALPAWQLARQSVSGSLHDNSRTPGGIRKRIRFALVAGEIALASLLLFGAGLTLRSVQTLLSVDAGFAGDKVLTTTVALPDARYSTFARRLGALDELERRFAALPGVRSVGATSHLPLSGQNSRQGITVEGYVPAPDTPTRAHPRTVTPGYFQTMGITLVKGRGFTTSDSEDAPKVAVVNETFVKQYLSGRAPLGARVLLNGTQGWREIVGIVRDVRHWGLDLPVNPEVYMPNRQFPMAASNVTLAVDGDPASFAPAVREQMRAVDPDLPMAGLRPMNEVAARSIASRTASMRLLAIFAGLALCLAAAGIYGVTTHLVALRRTEIGVRMSLGARPADVRRMILREGAVQAAAGLAVGLSAGVALMSGLRSLLYGVGPADPMTLGAVAAVLLGTVVLACLVPANRAMRLDPVSALRQ